MKHSNRLFLTAANIAVLFSLFVTTAGCGSNINSRASRPEVTVISDAHMTSSVDENGAPVDTIDTVSTTGTWYVSAFLSNGQPDTFIRFTWYNASGTVIFKAYVDPKGASDVYIHNSYAIPVAYEGRYQVDIFIDDATLPAATVYFTYDDGKPEAVSYWSTGPNCLPPMPSSWFYSSSPSATSP